MKVFVQPKFGFSEKIRQYTASLVQSVLGSLFLATLAQVSIPLYPVPMTLQTLGVFLLAVGLGGRKGCFSALFYLAFISLGFPFIAGGVSNRLWFAFPTAGYLVGFPIAAYVIGKLVHARKNPSSLWVLGSMCVGQLIIYTLGIGGLMRVLSFEKSLMVGLLPFLPFDGVKLLFGSGLGALWIRYGKRYGR